MSCTDDPSRQYVLDPAAPYLRNLAALWAVDPELARAIEALDDDAAYPTERSRGGEPTALVRTADGRQVYIHSRHHPLDEAQRLLDGIDTDACVAFYVHGMGLGYHVEQLFDRISREAIVCVLEPDLRMLRTAFEQRDLSRLIESRRVYFFTQADRNALLVKLTGWAAMFTMGFVPLRHPASMQLHPEFHRQMQQWIEDFLAFCRTSINTLVINGRRTAENIARNIGWYVAAPGIGRLHDRYRAKPAIIVSAGPSLRRNRHLLSAAADRAVIIAVQTTLQPLLEMGVEPHFVTSLDYHDVSTRFFEKLPRQMRSELVAEPKATSRIFELNPGPLSLLGNDFAENLLREMRICKPCLPAGATVAHLAFYLARHLGCDPIIFVGQDLGFSDGLCYTPGTSYEDVWRPELSRFCSMEMKQWEQIVRDRPILRRIPDVHGRPMYTEERLFTYLQQFERDFAETSARVIDSTEGGALKRGAEPMPLADAIQRFCTMSVTRVEDHPGLCWDRLRASIQSIEHRREEAGRIEQIGRQTRPLLAEIRDHLDDQRRVNRAIARTDVLRARMNELGACYDLITQLTQNTELQRFQRDRQISAAKVDQLERQRRQVARDIDNVDGLIAAASQFQQLMDQIMERLALMQQRYSPVATTATEVR